jgi:hypothetical protein
MLLGVQGVLMRLNGQFMGAQVIFFSVGRRGGFMGMGGQIVEFGYAIVGTLRHFDAPSKLHSGFMSRRGPLALENGWLH